jgi:Protein of unknown function (DUF3035)
MSANRVFAAVALMGAAATLSACGHAREALGMAKVTPDEFRVVSKAPLTLPPDYDLRPPAPGEPRPQELQPESAARLALLQSRRDQERSEGEKLLASKAGADKADPLARYVVDDEFGNIAYKDKSFAERVMFWKPGAPAATVAQNDKAAAAQDSKPLDPKVEAARIKELTDNKKVIIAKQAPKSKLPGL